MTVSGHCNCGRITAEIPEMPESSIICYCDNCQRSSAGGFSVNLHVQISDLTIKDPDKQLKSYKDSNTKSGNTITRCFCGNCGSPVASYLPEGATGCFLKGGLFDNPPAPCSRVAFPEHKAEWLIVQTKE